MGSKFVRLNFLISLFMISMQNPIDECSIIEFENINVCPKIIIDKKTKEYFIVLRYWDQENKMKKVVDRNFVNFNYYGKDSVFLLLNNIDTIRPTSYIFEDRFDATLPYYQQVFGFKDLKLIKNSKDKLFTTKNSGINYSYKIKN